MTLAETLAQAIRGSGRSLNAVAKGCGISEPSLSRFLNHGQRLALPSVQKLFDYFGLKVVAGDVTNEAED
jgi:hypothetical protein